MRQTDIIRLRNDLKNTPLKKGDEGTVVYIWNKDFIEVDFSDIYIEVGKDVEVDVVSLPVTEVEVVRYERIKKIKTTDLVNKLSKGVNLVYSHDVSSNNFSIHIFRLDISDTYKKDFLVERYRLRILKRVLERGSSRFKVTLNNSFEFEGIQEIIVYLDKKDYLKKEEWIIDT